jgi:hypothetical protein
MSFIELPFLALSQRTVEIWNNLTSKVVTAPTTMSFESRLDKFWENQPRKYNYSHQIVINTTGHDLNISNHKMYSDCVYIQSEE